MSAVLIVLALIFVLFVATGAYVTVKVVGAAKRGVDRTVNQARRAVEDSTLKARSYARPGPHGEIAGLRLSLRSSMRATQESLAARAGDDGGLTESRDLFRRLSVHGHALDDELRRLENDPDRAGLAAELPALRDRTRKIVGAADGLRHALRDRAHHDADDELDELSRQIDMETGALRHWAPAEGPRTRPAALAGRADRAGRRHGGAALGRRSRAGPRAVPTPARPGAARTASLGTPAQEAAGAAPPGVTGGRPRPASRACHPQAPHGPCRSPRSSCSGGGGRAGRCAGQVTSEPCHAMSRSSLIPRPTCRPGQARDTASRPCP